MKRGTWWFLLAALLAVTVWAYLPALANGLVWDDWTNLASDPPFAGTPAQLIQRAFTDVRLGHWQPLTWLSFGLDRLLWDKDVRGFHLTNVLLHLANVALFGIVAWRLFEAARPVGMSGAWSRWAALGAAAIFALHPMRVETVAWLTERRHLLSATFFLLAVWCWSAALEGRGRARPRVGPYAAAVVCYALSLLSTPLGIALPVVFLLLDVWPLGRWRRGAGWKEAAALVLEKLPFLGLAAIFSATALAAQHASDALVPAGRYSLVQRLAQTAYGALFYPRAMLATSWSPLYERPSRLDPFEPRFVISAVAFLAITALAVALRRRLPAVLATWLAYLVLLAPVSGLAQAGIQLVADRYGYLACLPLALLAGALVATVILDPGARVASWITGVSLLAALAWWTVASHTQARVWRDDRTLWTQVLSRGPSSLAHGHMALLSLREEQLGAALDHAFAAIETAPTYGRAWNTMIAVLEWPGIERERERLAATAKLLEANVTVQEDHPLAWYAVGLARAAGGEPAAAIPAFEEAVSRNPSLAQAWRALVFANFAAGRQAAARAALDRGLEAVPNDPVLLGALRGWAS